jgi:hypothetical protein
VAPQGIFSSHIVSSSHNGLKYEHTCLCPPTPTIFCRYKSRKGAATKNVDMYTYFYKLFTWMACKSRTPSSSTVSWLTKVAFSPLRAALLLMTLDSVSWVTPVVPVPVPPAVVVPYVGPIWLILRIFMTARTKNSGEFFGPNFFKNFGARFRSQIAVEFASDNSGQNYSILERSKQLKVVVTNLYLTIAHKN